MSQSPNPPSAPFLQVDDLAVDRGGRPVLRGVGFRLESGEALLVTGRNGVGKSTLLRALAGLLPLSGGRIAIGGAEEEDAAGSIHYLAHADGLKGPLTARENLEFWARYLGSEAKEGDGQGDRMKDDDPRPHAEKSPQEPSRSTRASSSGRSMNVPLSFETPASRAPQDEGTFIRSPWRGGLPVGEALALVGLAHAAEAPVAILSAGQKRRIALARLLVAFRPVWLLDEPASALDRASRERLAEAMGAHRARGGIVVAATHDALGLEGARELALGARA